MAPSPSPPLQAHIALRGVLDTQQFFELSQLQVLIQHGDTVVK